MLAKMGAREVNKTGSGPDVKTKIVKPKKKAASAAKKAETKRKVK